MVIGGDSCGVGKMLARDRGGMTAVGSSGELGGVVRGELRGVIRPQDVGFKKGEGGGESSAPSQSP